ncbi:MAG: bifunctional phosphoribosylaminoimidazolecarboxamide formyltransferase/IMP cyclohydrolase [Chloroflexota bacterium]
MRAIMSVSDKSGLADFARELSRLDYEIFSTGGTKKALDEARVKVTSISDLTGFPEILDGRVKTLHPAIYGGILARRGLPEHMAELKKNKIGTIDLVAVNLYPFVETVLRPGATFADAIENIDIGGPTLLRAAAKNFESVLVVVDPKDYPLIIERLKSGGADVDFRKMLAQKAFQHVALYDTAISQYLGQGTRDFPEEMTIALKKRFPLRYGENPHQKAAFYSELVVSPGQNTGITWAKVLGGKELSYNNIMDADSAWGVVTDYAAPTVGIIKHANPCGLASFDDLAEAYQRALSGDPLAAFGGIVACNRRVTPAMAEVMRAVFYEIVIAPGYEPQALEILRRKRDLRILEAELPPDYGNTPRLQIDYRRVKGGFLVQDADALAEGDVELKTVTQREPTPEEVRDMVFSWRAVKWVKSNAIVLAKDRMMVGMGAGQPSRIASVMIAKERAGERSKGSVMASDAMFPFPDSVEAAAAMGVTAIIQTGGSIRDEESIKAADKSGLAMVFTGRRHFRH